ncbi:enoyl-CoA hydratase/isomerase family protein [Nocardioides eburneiflavus]|uniref:Enoyl-CoA hydratase/isomerase family protein n=1 Tax=Nocardioides eburneiflavus TaxID=2518372 RepID=A0A4Z1CKJ6_9ACTN|nr:enoyl-CoA hydratase/isomerase family protein [Nocardioides eburneiflavus]TGN64710.1 enoyl-CoA hydratase/isomerase family protein [Nocardioides eburneiflavus]
MSVLRERHEHGVELLRIDRPANRNALDSSTLRQLVMALTELSEDSALRVLILSTTSVDAFCAGADVTEPLDTESGVARMEAFAELYHRLEHVPVPTIAACVGACVGAGAEIVAGCDLRVAGDNLKLAWAGARLGVPVGPARLTQLVGLSRAKELVYTGRTVGAAEAASYGLVHRVTPADQTETAAVELADQVRRQSSNGVRDLKQMFRHLEHTSERIAYENERLLDFQRHGAGLPHG